MKKMLILPALLLMMACAESRNPNANTPAAQNEAENKAIIAEGEVLQVKQGKDGYTAELKSSIGEIYFVTISRSNLKNPAQYKTVAVGEKLKVSGDLWKMESVNQITVREIL
jgi:hypothetical protein